MRCDNCGNKYQGGLTCPLCGHRHGNVSRCNVCSTLIYPGVKQCPNCGNPTKYVKKADVSEHYHGNFKTNTYSKQHYSAKPVKKQTDQVKKKPNIKKAKVKKNNYDYSDKKNKFRKFVTFVVAAVTIFGFISTIFFEDEPTETVEIEEIEISENNTDLMMAGNFQQFGINFLTEDEVYLGNNYRLTKSNYQLDAFDEIPDLGAAYLYVEDNYIYFADTNNYQRYNQETKEIETLFTFSKILPLKNHRFLYTNENDSELYLYENGTSNKILNNNIDCFTFDYETNLIYYSSGNDYVAVIDLNGSFKTTYELYVSNEIYVDNGLVYYQSYDGVHCFNTKNSEDTVILEEDLYRFIIVDEGILYTNYDSELYFYDQDTSYLIGENVNNFNVLGNTVVYEDNYEDYQWYIADYHTQEAAKLPNWYAE